MYEDEGVVPRTTVGPRWSGLLARSPRRVYSIPGVRRKPVYWKGESLEMKQETF